MVRTQDLKGRLKGRVGIVAPYDTRSALAFYVSQLKRSFPADTVRILSEMLPAPLLREQTPDVIPCFTRGASELPALRAAISQNEISILHIIPHRPFFAASAFTPLHDELRSKNVRVVFDLSLEDELDEHLIPFLRNADNVIVSDQQLAFELMSKGVTHERLTVMQQVAHHTGTGFTEGEARRSLGLNAEDRLVVGFTDGKSRIECTQLIDGVEKVWTKLPRTRLVIIPLDTVQAAGGHDYRAETLSELRREHASKQWLSIQDTWSVPEQLAKVLAAANAVVFSQPKPALEVSQALLLAITFKKAVIAPSIAPFTAHYGRIYLLNHRIGLSGALLSVLSHASVRSALGEACGQWAESHRFEEFVTELTECYAELRGGDSVKRATAAAPAQPQRNTPGPRTPRILMQCRENAYTQPGGDTVLMDRISEGLRARGVIIDIDSRGTKNPREYDLVHLFNFALKEQTERLAKQAIQLGVPYVVTTLYEDWPLFFNQMSAYYGALEQYIQLGQSKERWPELAKAAKAARPSPIWDNSLTANSSSILIATGEMEAKALRRDYPSAKRVETCLLGGDGFEFEDGGEVFRKETGLSDFVLCVGRFELRKNQLMLLKALEDSDLPVVFVGGGFSYQPAYADACRRFQRKGKTIFLGRLEPKQLASAFQAARVHALPGWLELPGLVSLEAARCGTNVVVTDYGTTRDYLGDLAFYCKPDDPETIRNSVTAAFHAPAKAGLRERARSFTWDKTAVRCGELYQMVLASRADYDWSFLREVRVPVKPANEHVQASIETASQRAKAAGQSVGMIPTVVPEPSDLPKPRSEVQKLCDEGDRLAKTGDIAGAKKQYQIAIERVPTFARAYRSCGALALNEQRLPDAEQFFVKAIELDCDDARALLGLGSVRWEQEKRLEAFDLYLKAAQKNPSDGLAILHLVRTAYAVERLEDLEQALRAFLKSDPDNINILYCLAGCSYRRGRLFLAQGVIDRILKLNPLHAEAAELKQKILDDQISSREVPANGNGSHAPNEAKLKINRAFEASTTKIDDRLKSLENDKRNRDYDSVVMGCDEVLRAPQITTTQRDIARALKAEALACKGDLQVANDLFQELEQSPEVGYRALSGRGAVCAAEGDMVKARNYFERSLVIKPDYDIALAGMGMCAVMDGKREEGWTFYERSLRSNPENRRALYGIIQLGYEMKRLRQTAKALETYLDYHPVDLAMNYSYAGCCYALGEIEKAVEECKKILLFDSTHRLALELLQKIESERKQAVHAR